VVADRCGRLLALLAVVLAAQGRAELALPRLAIAATLAAEEDDWELGIAVLHGAAEVAVVRRGASVDPMVLAGAYLDELGLRTDDCASELYRHDFLAIAAINQNRPEVAREHVARAGELTAGRCASMGPRINSIFAASHVLQHGGAPDQVAALRAAIAVARTGASTAGERALLDHAEGRLLIESDRAAGEARLRAAIGATSATGDDVPLKRARTYSFTVLALDAGRRGDYSAALALLADEIGGAAAQCTVGIVGEDRILVVASGADGVVTGRYGDVPVGQFSLPAAGLVPAELSSTLTGCARVVVLAKGAYYGLGRLLPASLAWSNRSSAGAATGDRRGLPGTRLVVTGIEPPASLGFPALRAEPDVQGAIVLRAMAATPRRVLDEARRAATLEIHAHGLIDVTEPGAAALVLSPDAGGEYALTADAVAGVRLDNHPVVILGACHAGSIPRSLEPWGLADAFITAGAQAVIASPALVPDTDGANALAAIAARVRGGDTPAAAVRDERVRRGGWLEELVIF
jgi:sarcosine oxidase gamma subunit